MILVSHPGAGAVDLFDPQKRRIVGHILDMWSPRGVAVDEAAHLVYIANSGARNIVVVSTNDWQVKRTIPVESAPDALFVSQARICSTYFSRLTVHRGHRPCGRRRGRSSYRRHASAHVVTRLALEGRPYAFAYDPSRQPSSLPCRTGAASWC